MADALDSKSSMGNHVRVQVPPSAPIKKWVYLTFFIARHVGLEQSVGKQSSGLFCRTRRESEAEQVPPSAPIENQTKRFGFFIKISYNKFIFMCISYL